jgi:hypothetical protein
MTLQCQKQQPSITKDNRMFKLNSLLKWDDSQKKMDVYKSYDMCKHLNILTCLEPFLPSLTIFIGPSDSFLQS